jgi:hypothetical protein
MKSLAEGMAHHLIGHDPLMQAAAKRRSPSIAKGNALAVTAIPCWLR